MVLNIHVIPKAGKNLIKKERDILRVYLTKPPQDNLANQQLIELLAEYLNVKKYRIRIIKGNKSRNKTVEISEALQGDRAQRVNKIADYED